MTQTNGTSQKEMKVDAVIIGAGLSGIATLYRLRKLGLKAVILEAGSEFGGVWNFNRYPGVSTPLHIISKPVCCSMLTKT